MIKYIVLGFMLLSINITAVALPTAKLTLSVVDESGMPVESAKVGMSFSLPPRIGEGPDSVRTVKRGVTDAQGVFTASNETQKYIGYTIRKKGYYLTTGKVTAYTGVSGVLGLRRWEPWNPTLEVVLKKKINPIALYVRNMEKLLSRNWIDFPVVDEFVGYDLIARDWVVPYGQGTHRDFLLRFEKHRTTARRDYHVTLTVQFPNEGDGIQSYYDEAGVGSDLRLPHHAPTSGYLNEVVVNRERSPDKRSKPENKRNREDQNYFFRVRTEKDEKGNIVSALYGKMHGGFDLVKFKKKNSTGKIRFSYYLNPTPNDTNLEFDPIKNLFND